MTVNETAPALEGLRCANCGAEFAAERHYVCLECFGPLDAVYDYDRVARSLDPIRIAGRPRNLWRYRELLPVTGTPIAGDHSGWTPLIEVPRLARRLGVRRLFLKDDSANYPTLSYKDRVVSVALSKGLELGYSTFACASTGNLAHSVAAHCARAGLPCLVFVPHDIERAKIGASLAYGTQVVTLEGNYDQVNRLCAEIGDEFGWGFVNVNLRTYYAEGAKTLAYEIAEQLDWQLPEQLVLPVAGGTLLPRVALGINDLRQLGWAEGPCRLFAAQAEGCSPVVKAWEAGHEYHQPVRPQTLAHSIAIGDPADGPRVLDALRESGGGAAAVSDDEIVSAIELLASTEGVFTEPAGGTTLAATLKLLEQGLLDPDATTVVTITGHGLKAVETLLPRWQVAARIRPNLQEFRNWHSDREGVAQ